VAKEKKEKETSAVKYNNSGHYCGRRYNKTIRHGNIFIFCAHYYRIKAFESNSSSGARAVDLPARSFDLARPGVAPPLRAGYLINRFVGTRPQRRITSTWNATIGILIGEKFLVKVGSYGERGAQAYDEDLGQSRQRG